MPRTGSLRLPTLALTAVAAMLLALALVAPAAESASGASCGSIATRNVRDGATTYRVTRTRGTCQNARRVLRDWSARVYRRATAGACTTNTCSDAPSPPGYRCGNSTAGQEASTGRISSCVRGRTAYRAYSR